MTPWVRPLLQTAWLARTLETEGRRTVPWTHEEDIELNLLTVTSSTDETDSVVQDLVADLPGDDLVDEAGRRWSTHWARWCDVKQVRQFLHREQDVLVRASTGGEVTRLSAEQARVWWREVHRCFEEPGKAAPSWSAGGLTWAAHVWHCDDGGEPSRLLVFDTFC